MGDDEEAGQNQTERSEAERGSVSDQGALGTPPAVRRREVIEDELIPFAKRIFAKGQRGRTLHSLLFCVAQYYNDEAMDAVHARIILSSNATPRWPHMCGSHDRQRRANRFGDVSFAVLLGPSEACDNCGDFDWFPFGDNDPDTINAFAPCCLEGADTERPMCENYLPYAVVRRRPLPNDSENVEIEIVGGPMRASFEDSSVGSAESTTTSQSSQPTPATLPADTHANAPPLDATTAPLLDLVYASPDDDSPRHVIADHFLQRSNPLGEYIACSMAIHSSTTTVLEDGVGDEEVRARERAERGDRAELAALHRRAAELERQHGLSWLGVLAKITPPEYVVFDRGFLRSLTVHMNESNAVEVLAAREWGTVQELRFLPDSIQRFSPRMRSLRSVGPLDQAGLWDLQTGLAAKAKAALPISRMHVVIDGGSLATLADLDIKHMTSPLPLRCLTLGMDEGRYGLGDDANLSPTTVEPLLRTSWWRDLEEVVIGTIEPSAVRAWLDLPRASRPRTLSFTNIAPVSRMTSGFRMRVCDDDKYNVATIEMLSLQTTRTLLDVAAMIPLLPKNLRIRVNPTRYFTPTPKELEKLSELASRPVDVGAPST